MSEKNQSVVEFARELARCVMVGAFIYDLDRSGSDLNRVRALDRLVGHVINGIAEGPLVKDQEALSAFCDEVSKYGVGYGMGADGKTPGCELDPGTSGPVPSNYQSRPESKARAEEVLALLMKDYDWRQAAKGKFNVKGQG